VETVISVISVASPEPVVFEQRPSRPKTLGRHGRLAKKQAKSDSAHVCQKLLADTVEKAEREQAHFVCRRPSNCQEGWDADFR
jgi:hypothetical protein